MFSPLICASTHSTSPSLSRRQLLHTLGAGVGAGIALGTAPRVWAQAAPAGAKLGQGRVVVVFLRGAYDGLSALVPYADADYYKLRPTIAIAAPNGNTNTAIKLDDTFALHPSMAVLMPLWQQGVLSFVPAAGMPAPNRSHFDAQYQMETGHSGKTSGAPGWINTLAGLNKAPAALGVDKTPSALGVDKTPSALGVGEANPAILSGNAKVKLIPQGQAAERVGVLANATTRQALLDLYAGNDKVSTAFRQGADSRMQSAKELSTEKNAMDNRRNMETLEAKRSMDRQLDKDGTPANTAAQNAQMQAASNGAADPVGLQLDAQHLGTLMRNDRNLSLGFLSAGGWDTHANQGNVTGQLADRLGNLAKGIAQLRQEFSEPHDTIVVMSEFGRTSAENGTKGTDHGFGNAMWLVGNRVQGGQWHGQWTGLARGNLNENRDLPAHHDYRAVLAQVLRSTFALPDSALSSVLPNANWDSGLDKLMLKA
jgi:uncharacterized protein (DUF1501 family)